MIQGCSVLTEHAASGLNWQAAARSTTKVLEGRLEMCMRFPRRCVHWDWVEPTADVLPQLPGSPLVLFTGAMEAVRRSMNYTREPDNLHGSVFPGREQK